MTKQLLLTGIILTLGFSACNNSVLPTDSEHLGNPSGNLGTSKFGQALSESEASVGAMNPASPVEAVPLDTTGPTWRHIGSGSDKSKYFPEGYEQHIKDDYNRSKYKPTGWEHIKTDIDKSKYKPEGYVHYNGERAIDKSKYIKAGYKHITKGADETRYGPSTSTSIGEVGDTPIDTGEIGADTGGDVTHP